MAGFVEYQQLTHASGAFALQHFFPNYSGREEQRQGACEIARIIGIDKVPDVLLADLGIAFWNDGVLSGQSTHIEWYDPDEPAERLNPPSVMSLTLARLLTRAQTRVGPVSMDEIHFPARVPGIFAVNYADRMQPRFMHHGMYANEQAAQGQPDQMAGGGNHDRD